MRKVTIIMFIVGFFTGLLLGILMINDIQNDFSKYAIYLYLLVIIGSIVFLNVKYQRIDQQIFIVSFICINNVYSS